MQTTHSKPMKISRCTFAAAVAFSLLFPLVGQAGDQQNADSTTCIPAETDAELYDCEVERSKRNAESMEKIYSCLLEDYVSSEKPLAELFEKSQVAWIAWRDAKCDVDTYYSRGGTAYEIYQLDCISTMNEARIAELEDMAAAP